jgi:TubC N-terminal docking domain
MKLVELLDQCAQVGVELAVDDRRLRCRTPKGGITQNSEISLPPTKLRFYNFFDRPPQ